MTSSHIGINFFKQFDSNTIDSQTEAIAWVGLQGTTTTAWNDLTPAQQNAILNTYFTWRNSASKNCY